MSSTTRPRSNTTMNLDVPTPAPQMPPQAPQAPARSGRTVGGAQTPPAPQTPRQHQQERQQPARGAISNQQPKWKTGMQAFKDILALKEDAIGRMIPKTSSMSAKRLIANTLGYIHNNPDLLLCTDHSILYATMAAARMGLDFMGGYLFMRKNQKMTWNPDSKKNDLHSHYYASLMPHYKGLMVVLDRNGYTASAQALYENDVWNTGHDANGYYLEWNIPKENRGQLVGAWAKFARKDQPGTIVHLEYMSKHDIESFAPKKGDSWAWDGDSTRPEMYRKSPLRRGFKYLPPTNDEMAFVVEVANRGDGNIELDDMFVDDDTAPGEPPK